MQRIYSAFLAVFFLYVALWIFSSNDNFKFHCTVAQTFFYALQNLLLLPVKTRPDGRREYDSLAVSIDAITAMEPQSRNHHFYFV